MDDSLTRLSVVVATRNRSDHLVRLLESLRAAIGMLNSTPAEVVVADNGSTDKTQRILSDFRNASAFGVEVVDVPIAGKANALNQALMAATGTILAFVDDDIIVSQDWAKAIVRVFDDNPELDAVGGFVGPADDSAAETTLRTQEVHSSVRLEDISPKNIPVIGCNIAYRRTLLETIGGFDPNIGPGSRIGSGDDLDLLYRALSAGARIEYCPQVSVVHDHGRVDDDAVVALRRRYLRGRGAFYHKFASNKDERVRKWAYWEIRSLALSLTHSPWTWHNKRRALSGLIALAGGALVSMRIRGVRARLDHPGIGPKTNLR